MTITAIYKDINEKGPRKYIVRDLAHQQVSDWYPTVKSALANVDEYVLVEEGTASTWQKLFSIFDMQLVTYTFNNKQVTREYLSVHYPEVLL